MRSVIEANTTPAYDKAQALHLYVEQSEMDALLQEDMNRYKGALEATGGAVDDIEPISRFHEVYQGHCGRCIRRRHRWIGNRSLP